MYIATFYDATGQIVGVMSGPRESVEATALVTGNPFVEGEGDPDRQYVWEGALVPRPELPATLAGRTLSGLPVPCLIRIGDVDYPCAEPVVELEFSHPGIFQVSIETWPYLNKEFTVENPAL